MDNSSSQGNVCNTFNPCFYKKILSEPHEIKLLKQGSHALYTQLEVFAFQAHGKKVRVGYLIVYYSLNFKVLDLTLNNKRRKMTHQIIIKI